MDGPAHAALMRLCGSLGGGIDMTVLQYLANVLQPEELDSTCLEDVVELLSGACPAYGSLPVEEQTAHVLALLDEVASAAAPSAAVPQQAPLPFAVSTSADLPAAQLAQLGLGLESMHDRGTRCSDSSGDGATEASSSPAVQPEVQQLLALCPAGISPGFILHVLRDLNNCDAQAAADWILDCSDISCQEQAWLDHKRDQELDKERQKQAILERFDLQAVPEVPLNGGKSDKALDQWGCSNKKQKEQAPQVRYRDGQCHRTKDKYIVEKVGEDWNGGSTGKVISKGKRGKGFY